MQRLAAQALLLLRIFTEQHQSTPGDIWTATRNLRFPNVKVKYAIHACCSDLHARLHCAMCVVAHVPGWTLPSVTASLPRCATVLQDSGGPVTDERRHALRTDFLEVSQALFTVKGFWNQFHREQRHSAEYWPVRAPQRQQLPSVHRWDIACTREQTCGASSSLCKGRGPHGLEEIAASFQTAVYRRRSVTA